MVDRTSQADLLCGRHNRMGIGSQDYGTGAQDQRLLISAPKSTVTPFTPDPMQSNTHPKIKIYDAEFPLVRNPKLLGVCLDTFFSFHAHCVQVTNRVSKRNNVLKTLAGTNWGQQKETLLLTYKALGRSIANYAAPVWSTIASDTSLERYNAHRMKH